MDGTKKNIDELVATRNRKQAELLAIGQEIVSSVMPIVVIFVDLAESTEMKQDREPEDLALGTSLSSFSALTSEHEMPTVQWSSGSVMSS